MKPSDDAGAGSSEGGGDQPLVGFRSNAQWEELVARTGAMIEALDRIGDDADRQAVFAALGGIDAIHREALHRLVRLFKEGVLEQVLTDPAIRTLMTMYGLAPDAEPGARTVAVEFADLRGHDAGAGPSPAHWSPAPIPAPPEAGAALACRMEEGAVVLARVEDRLYAFADRCPVHEAPLHEGRLENLSWICPLGAGCVYDVRNGARLGGGPRLECLAVRTEADGRILVGFGVPFEPEMPAF